VLDADAGLLETEREIRARRKSEEESRSRERIGVLLDEWLRRHTPSLQGATAARYRGLAERIKVLAEDVSLSAFSRRDASALFAKLSASGGVKGKPLGSSSVRQARVLLSQALDEAVDFGIVETNVVARLKLSLRPTAERNPPSVDEIRSLLEASEREDDLAAPVALAASCGMRRGEILGLKWSEVDLDRALLNVSASLEEVGATVRLKAPKTARSRRTLALPASVVATLRLHRRRQREWALRCGVGYDREADLVNPGPDGKPWRPSTFSDRYLAFAKNIGVKGTFHDLRHSHGSALIAGNVDARTVADRLGHANVGFTMQRYVHAAKDSDRRAADAFEVILRGPMDNGANESAS
jgi:integrase